MPMQLLIELAIFVAGFAGLSYMLKFYGSGYFRRFWQGILFWAFILAICEVPDLSSDSFQCARDVWIRFVRCGVHVDVGNEEDWKKFQAANH